MKNLDPSYFILIVFLLASFCVYLFYKLKQRIEIENFLKVYTGLSSKVTLPPRWILILRYSIYSIIVILLCISILNPSFSEESGADEKIISGVDIVFLVDVSLSMNATDVLPNRLSQFKETVLRLLPSLNGNRLGIIAFAGVPFLYCPMTNDIAAFSDYIRGLDVDMIPNTGTNLKKAFAKAEEIFKSGKVLRNKVLILVTDGEDIKGSTPARLNADLVIWGVGTEEGGGIFYKDEQTGIAGYVTRSGNLIADKSNTDLIRTKLDEEYLLELASIQKADYSNISAQPQSADKLISKIQSMSKNTSSKLSNMFKKDGYQYFLFPALILFLLDISLLEYLFRKYANMHSNN
ncbi:MAG TPA: VWA domain-containing protein [Leptospiraceae bacterium]|nr:VWA domain-containing protein [Leptospiraceae bacterium]HMW03802.1 VWA domain-containing protein [Leptospiraceae bacterium]HMX34801.1 VWA domain-containing protein [Leptospiraceae bacterium]HMY29782.1 VWA domain-containing protein [Leptospiraceae bacterium]HMZ62819.1 VWA domain-containing protein [Leptospiraceae bacterium]